MRNLLTLAPETLERHAEIVRKALKDAVGRTYLGVEDGRRAFAYPRVSGAKQAKADRTGIAREIQTIDKLAKRLRRYIPFENIYADDYTGQEELRPHLDRLLVAMSRATREERMVLAEGIDRVGRGRAIQYLVERSIRRAGGELKLDKEPDELTKLAFGFAAEVEVYFIKTRTRGGNLIRMGRGEIISNRPRYGYRIVRTSGKAQFEKEPRQARVVDIIHRWFQRYRSIVKLQYSLHRRGIQAPGGGKVWSTDTLLRILRDETYIGTHHQNRYVVERTGEYTRRGKAQTRTTERPREEWQPVEVPVLIKPALFRANQKLLDANRGRAGRKPRLSMLRSLLHCSCGRRMTVTKNETGVEYYACPRRSRSEVKRHGKAACKQRYIPVAEVDPKIWELLKRFLLNATFMHRLLVEQHGSAGTSADRSDLERAVHQAERALVASRDALDAAMIRGEVPAELLAAAERARERHKEAAASLAAHAHKLAKVPSVKEVQARLGRFNAAALGLEQRHRIALALIDRAVVDEKGETLTLEGVLPERDKSFDIATAYACVLHQAPLPSPPEAGR
jgi:hypothetical protein